MSWLSGGELHSGAWTSSNYAGLGILLDNLPTTGDNGGSPLLNDGGVSGDEVRWELLNSSGVTLTEFNEDGSFASDGVGSFTYRSFVNNASVGDFTVTINAAGVSYSITCETLTDTSAANDVSFYRGYIMAIDTVTDSHIVGAVDFRRGYNLTCGTVTDIHQAGEITLTYTTPAGAAYSITCEAVADTHQAAAILFNRGYVMQAGTVTDNHLALPVNLIFSGEQIALITTYSVNYKQFDVSTAYKPTLIEVTYGDR